YLIHRRRCAQLAGLRMTREHARISLRRRAVAVRTFDMACRRRGVTVHARGMVCGGDGMSLPQVRSGILGGGYLIPRAWNDIAGGMQNEARCKSVCLLRNPSPVRRGGKAITRACYLITRARYLMTLRTSWHSGSSVSHAAGVDEAFPRVCMSC